jgi:hypothetical protein
MIMEAVSISGAGVTLGDPTLPLPVSDSGGPGDTPSYPQLTDVILTGASNFLLAIGGGVGISRNGTAPTGFTSMGTLTSATSPSISFGLSYKRIFLPQVFSIVEPAVSGRGEGVFMLAAFEQAPV